jgi:hypothetical protein
LGSSAPLFGPRPEVGQVRNLRRHTGELVAMASQHVEIDGTPVLGHAAHRPRFHERVRISNALLNRYATRDGLSLFSF